MDHKWLCNWLNACILKDSSGLLIILFPLLLFCLGYTGNKKNILYGLYLFPVITLLVVMTRVSLVGLSKFDVVGLHQLLCEACRNIVGLVKIFFVVTQGCVTSARCPKRLVAVRALWLVNVYMAHFNLVHGLMQDSISPCNAHSQFNLHNIVYPNHPYSNC